MRMTRIAHLLAALAFGGITFLVAGSALAQPAHPAVGQMLGAAANKGDARINAIRTQLQQEPRPAAVDAAAAARLNTEATAAARNGDTDTALRLWKQALQADPGHAAYLANVGLVLLKLNRPAEAIEGFSRALELDPGNWRIWFNLGRALAANKMQAEAASSFYLATHFSDAPDDVLDLLRSQARNAESSMELTNASRMALSLGAAKASDPATRAANRVKPAADIEGFKSLVLNQSERFDLSKPGNTKDVLYKRAEQSYMDGYLQGREQTYFQNAVWALRKAAFLGHAEAPGLLGIILANGYTTIAGQNAAPDVDEALKLFQLSDARGGTMGVVGMGDLAMAGKGQPANTAKGIGLYEKAAAAKNELAARRLIALTLEAKDPKIVADAKAALARAEVAPSFVASVVHTRTAGNREMIQLICVSLEDDMANAARRGNKMDLIYLRSMAQQLHCK